MKTEFATTTTSGEDHFLALTKNGRCFSAHISHLLNEPGKLTDHPLASFREDFSVTPHGKMVWPHTRFRLTLEKYLAARVAAN
jgi:hypothetical protein